MPDSCPPAPQDKTAIRAWARQRRAARTEEDAARDAERLCRRLAAWPALHAARVVAGYLPLPGELSPEAVLADAHHQGKQVLVPAWNPVGRRYAFCRWTPDAPCIPGPMRVPEPAAKDWFSPLRPDLVFVPGLAFDHQGHRIGFGAGHYDRLLARCSPKALRAGLGFAWQRLERLPSAPHDVPMHVVATPDGIWPGTVASRPVYWT